MHKLFGVNTNHRISIIFYTLLLYNTCYILQYEDKDKNLLSKKLLTVSTSVTVHTSNIVQCVSLKFRSDSSNSPPRNLRTDLD